VTVGADFFPRTLAGQAERKVRQLLEAADIRVGGSRPHDIQVHDRRFYLRVLRDGRLGLGESYMDGQWDAGALDQLTAKLILSPGKQRLPSWRNAIQRAAARLWNLQSIARAFQAGERHYDVGNDLYRAMLGETLYTCAYWKDACLDGRSGRRSWALTRCSGCGRGCECSAGCGWAASPVILRAFGVGCGLHRLARAGRARHRAVPRPPGRAPPR
jgi:cyclopropane-fatty-acyl-phospholipid synthase